MHMCILATCICQVSPNKREQVSSLFVVSWKEEKRGRTVRIPNALSQWLLNLHYAVRLGMVLLLFLICVILLVFGFPSPYDGSLFAVPVALAAWLFKQRGAFLCIGGTLLVIAVTYQVRANGLGPQSLLTVLIIGAVALMTE